MSAPAASPATARGPWRALLAGVAGGLVAGGADAGFALASSTSAGRGLGVLPLGLGLGAALGAALAVCAWTVLSGTRRFAATGALLAAPVALYDAFAMFAGPQASRIPGRHALSVGLAVAGVAAVAALARLVAGSVDEARVARGRRRAIATLVVLVVVAAAAHVANRRVLPRLYPWFHATLSLAVVSALALAARTAIAAFLGTRFAAPPAGRRERRVALGALALGLLLLAGGFSRLLRSDSVRFLVFERSSMLGPALKLVPGLLARRPQSLAKRAAEAAEDMAPLPEGPHLPDADVVLITIDALRADHVGAYGYGRPTTPHLDALARRGVRFERAYAQAPHTSFAVASMLTGKYYPTIARLSPGDPHDPVASILRRYGWKTAAFYPPAVFFVDADKLKAYQENNFQFEYVKVEFVDAHARLSQIAEFFETEKPRRTFLWVHFFEPHEPYDAWPGFDFGPRDIDRYDSEIAYTDAAVGRLVKYIESRRPGAIFIVTADHGEEFDEHGGRYHGRTLYEEQIRVPLIIVAPGLEPHVVGGQVEVIDIAPTILGLLDMPVPVRMRGTNLGPWLAHPPAPAERLPPAFAEVEDKRMMVWRREKLICDLNFGFCAYHDLATDPGETRNLTEDRPERVAELRRRLDDWLDDHGRFEPQLLKGLANPNGETIPQAIERGRLGHLGVIGDLFALLGSEQPLSIRREAARLLVTHMPMRRATREQVRAALSNPDPEIRAWMAVAAGRLGENDVRGALRQIVTAAPGAHDGELRTRAALALADLTDATGLDVLAQTLDACPSVGVCRLAIAALGSLRDRRAVAPLLKHLPEVQNRREMVAALGDIGDPSAVPALRQRLHSDEYVPVRAEAAAALAKIGGPEAREAVEAAARTEREPAVVTAIRQALERFAAPATRPGAAGGGSAPTTDPASTPPATKGRRRFPPRERPR